VYTAIHLGVAWVLVGYLGVKGAGIAFFVSYVCHGLLVYPIVRWITGFRWSAANRRLGLVSLAFIGLVFCCFYVLPFWLATAVGGLSALSSAAYCLRALVRLVSPRGVSPALYKLLVWARLVPRGGP